jgi:hypothetical protein
LKVMMVIGQIIGQGKTATIAGVPMSPQVIPPYVARALDVCSLLYSPTMTTLAAAMRGSGAAAR